MDYKQKYEEALERAKDLHDNHPLGIPLTWMTCEKIFPELKESEDERIRKGLIKGLSAMRDIHKHQTFSDDAINIDDAIAWLEKQGEQKPAWSEEDKEMINFIINVLECAPDMRPCSEIYHESAYQKQINWLKSIKPNHWKPSEEQTMAIEIAINVLTDKKFHIAANHLKSIYDAIKNL